MNCLPTCSVTRTTDRTKLIYGDTAESSHINLLRRAVRFSGSDAVNHFFGPSSLESEDMMLQLDRTLGDLLAFIDETVGLNKTLIVLSADHGMAEMPKYMTELGFPAGRLYPDHIIAATNQIADQRFDIKDIVRFYYRPYLYLDTRKIESANLDAEKVQIEIAAALTEGPGIALAVAPTLSALLGMTAPGLAK